MIPRTPRGGSRSIQPASYRPKAWKLPMLSARRGPTRGNQPTSAFRVSRRTTRHPLAAGLLRLSLPVGRLVQMSDLEAKMPDAPFHRFFPGMLLLAGLPIHVLEDPEQATKVFFGPRPAEDVDRIEELEQTECRAVAFFHEAAELC